MVASLATSAARSFLLLGALAGLDVGRQQQHLCGLPAVGAVASFSSAAAAVAVQAVVAMPVHGAPVDAGSTRAIAARGVAGGGGGESPPFVVGGGRGGGGWTAGNIPRGSFEV